ncbi:uncharacterized protein PRD47_019011 isoform 1-T2 [Ara ararauna]
MLPITAGDPGIPSFGKSESKGQGEGKGKIEGGKFPWEELSWDHGVWELGWDLTLFLLEGIFTVELGELTADIKECSRKLRKQAAELEERDVTIRKYSLLPAPSHCYSQG